MTFSVITPSFRQSQWLKLCVASVADQGIAAEHIVQDACSDDGTLDWLLTDPRVKAYSEKDSGMYDAVNRGFRRAGGEILSYLNCDEQYLPGALQAARAYFERHPDVEMLFGDCLVVGAEGEFLCYRKVQKPWRPHVMVSHLPTFTAATFIRRSVLDKHGLFFDTQWRDCGDAEWVLRALEKGVRMDVTGEFMAVFTDTGDNLSSRPNALREKRLLAGMAPMWAQKLAPALAWRHRLNRLARGAYRQKPFDYSIYTLAAPRERSVHHVARPTFVWKGRLKSIFKP
ncbi:MAG TPA: glycosyltransferase family 2 protein [Verrucomicrobiae bacterium]|jgi:glycosyltransferase involved in cell wall biosynthesis